MVREIIVRNDSNETLAPPRVRLSFDEEIGMENVWGATAALNGKTVQLTGAEWNASVAPGDRARMAFKGIGKADGITCTVLEEGQDVEVQASAQQQVNQPVSREDEPAADESAPDESSLVEAGSFEVAELIEPVVIEAMPTEESSGDEASTDEVAVDETTDEGEPVEDGSPEGLDAGDAPLDPMAEEPGDEEPSEPADDSGSRVVWSDDAIEAGSPGQRWRGLADTQIIGDCGEGRGKCMEVSYEPTSRGSSRIQTSVDLPEGTDYSVRYDIRFGEGFEFVQGGKLPGLAPSEPTAGCRAASADSWSARPMWRAEGAGQAYYYGQDRSNSCGEGEYGSAGAFKPGQWQTIEMRVRLNSDVVNYDGEITLNVDGQEVSRNDNLRLRTSKSAAANISSFLFSTFYGGADPSWAPSKTTSIRYDNFQVLAN